MIGKKGGYLENPFEGVEIQSIRGICLCFDYMEMDISKSGQVCFDQ